MRLDLGSSVNDCNFDQVPTQLIFSSINLKNKEERETDFNFRHWLERLIEVKCINYERNNWL